MFHDFVWHISILFVTTVTFFNSVKSLENGLARKPVMGWLAWTRFMCEIDCKKRPKECISENLFVEMADVLVDEGYRDAGYIQINVDDCWAVKQRNSKGEMIADPVRFPHGIKWLGDYLHERGLKLGMYANYGQYTCMGYPGTRKEDMEKDAKLFASWGADMLKFDGCFNDPTTLDEAYPIMGKALNETGKPIIYSCSWPYYVRTKALKEPNYGEIEKHCNLWRNYEDIQLNFASIQYIIAFYDHFQDVLAKHHGPGHWNDPDMIIIGNPQLTLDQCKVQMALWCIWSAPLLMSNDLRQMTPGSKQILLNRKLIAVNQDPLGIMGKLVKQIESLNIYVKKMTPTFSSVSAENSRQIFYSYAIAFYNRDANKKVDVAFRLEELGIPPNSNEFQVEELFSEDISFGRMKSGDRLELAVNPHSAQIFKLTLIGTGSQEKFQIFDFFNRYYIIFCIFLIFFVIFWRKRLRFWRCLLKF